LIGVFGVNVQARLRALQNLLPYFGQAFGRCVNQNTFDGAACNRRTSTRKATNKQQVRRSLQRGLTQSGQSSVGDINLLARARSHLFLLAQNVAAEQNRSRHTERGQGRANQRRPSKNTGASTGYSTPNNWELLTDKFSCVGKCRTKAANVAEVSTLHQSRIFT
jgi:hypothetical protein